MVDPVNHPLGSEDEVYADVAAPPIANGKERQAARVEAAVRAREREHNDLAQVLQSEPGQAFVMRLLAHCRPYQSVLSTEPVQMAAAEGRRGVGLWLLDQIQRIDPGMYPALLIQHAKRQRSIASVEAGIRQAAPKQRETTL